MKAQTVRIYDITDFVICYLKNEGINVSPLLLQKVLYYIQAWHLVFFEKHPLFEDEPEAWVNGPVYRRIYDKFKDEWYGESLTICKDEEVEERMESTLATLNLTPDQKEYLFSVLQAYGMMPPKKLVYLTHAEEPWKKAREGYGPFDICTNLIKHDSMYQYYSKRLNEPEKV